MTEKNSSLKFDGGSAPQVYVEDGGGQRLPIHPLWLRERCQDAASMDALTGQRLHDPSDLDLDLRYLAISESPAGCLHVKFSDGHQAEFVSADILAEAAMPPGDIGCPTPLLWDARLHELPRAAWSNAVTDAEIEGWLTQFLQYGFIIFSGVPATEQQVLKAAQVFGWVRDTNFGAMFDVRSKPEATDLAYSALYLDPHNDNPYRTPMPGVQLLHCLANETSGGLSTMVDGFAVAKALRERDPDAFAILTRTPIRFRYRDAVTELAASAPPIELDVAGEVKHIHFSPRLDFVPLLPLPQLTAYYRARRVFDHLLRSPEFELRFLLKAGDLVMFDNIRLLHGRTAFDANEGLRHLQGCYIDIDGPRSRYLVLKRGREAAQAATLSNTQTEERAA